jgi:hypothetical protein
MSRMICLLFVSEAGAFDMVCASVMANIPTGYLHVTRDGLAGIA